jgi:glycosyltransferase involved in cell wall biosynthesis
MRPIRVTLVVKLYPPWMGGLELHVAKLAETLLANHCDLRVSVVTAHTGPAWATRENIRGVPVERATTLGRYARTPIAPGIPLSLAVPLGRIARTDSQRRADRGDALPRRGSTEDAAPIYRPIIRRLRRADRVVAWTPELVESSEILREFRHKVTISPGGIDTAPFLPTPRSRERARTLRDKWAARGPLVLFVGRLVYLQRHRLLAAGDGRCSRDPAADWLRR